MIGTTDRFFKSVSLLLDRDHPERFSHFYPTKKSTQVIQAVLDGKPAAASMVVAAYGSGKSLAAGIATMAVENTSSAQEVLSVISERLAAVDKQLSATVETRIKSCTQGITIVLEGHQPDLAGAIIEQAKQQLRYFREPRRHNGEILHILDAVSRRAHNQGRDRISIIWDEFGRHLETLASSGHAEVLSEVQQIAEWASRQEEPTATFTILLHQTFFHYVGNLSQAARNSWRKIEGRFGLVRYVEDSREMYELIASVIERSRDIRRPPTLKASEKAAERALGLGLFESFGNKGKLTQTLRNAYPLHPAALHMLPRVAARLAQNERTVFSFLREANLGQSQTLRNLYRYFSEAMEADTGIGGTHRRWLESESALSKAAAEEESEIIAAAALLGLGTSGERVRVRKDVLRFAVTDVDDPSQAIIDQTIDGLIDRNLLLYRQRNDDISVWHGTDVDLRAHLEEEKLRISSELNTVEILSKEHPPPYWRPVAHNVKNRIRRFFAGAYVSANDLLREGTEHPLLQLGAGEDGRVVYCLVETSEEILELRSFVRELSSLDLGIILVVPEHPTQTLDIALEIMALRSLGQNYELLATDPFVLPEIQHMIDAAQEHLAHIVSRIVSPSWDGLTWFSKGQELLVRNEGELRERLSELSDERFPSTPRINNELIVRQKISRPMVNARKKLILGILEQSGRPHLGFDVEATTPDVALHRTVLVQTGLYRKKDTGWGWAVTDEIKEHGLAELWGRLQDFFATSGFEKSPAAFLESLERPPHGTRKAVLPILVAAGLQAFGRAVVIRYQGSYLFDILASQIEDFCSTPDEFSVDVLEVDAHQAEYLQDLVEQFGGTPVHHGDLIRQFYDALESWKAQLPTPALNTRQVSPEARSLQVVLRTINDPAILALEEFPKLAGALLPNDDTLEVVANLRQELEGIVDGYTAKAIAIIHDFLALAPNSPGNMLHRAKEWSACFNDGAISSSELDHTSRAILTRAAEATNGRYTEASFARALSMILLGKGLDRWDDASPREFADRLRGVVTRAEQELLEAEIISPTAAPLLERRIKYLFSKLDRMLAPDARAGLIEELKSRTNENDGLSESAGG